MNMQGNTTDAFGSKVVKAVSRNWGVALGGLIVVVLWTANMALPIPCLIKTCGALTVGNQGLFGDKFGAVNALFSGFSIVGIIWAIIQQEQQLNLARDELKNTHEMLKIARDDADKTKEILDKQVEQIGNQIQISEDQDMLQRLSIFQQTALKMESNISYSSLSERGAIRYYCINKIRPTLVSYDAATNKKILTDVKRLFGDFISLYVSIDKIISRKIRQEELFQTIYLGFLSDYQLFLIAYIGATSGGDCYIFAQKYKLFDFNTDNNIAIGKSLAAIFPREYFEKN